MILVSGSGLVRVWVRPRFVFGLVSGFAFGSGVWVGVRFVSDSSIGSCLDSCPVRVWLVSSGFVAGSCPVHVWSCLFVSVWFVFGFVSRICSIFDSYSIEFRYIFFFDLINLRLIVAFMFRFISCESIFQKFKDIIF